MSDLSGWFYKTFIDPLLAGGRKTITEKIPENQSILDVACGTGAQVFELAKKAKKVVGVDLSEKMNQTAQKVKAKLNKGRNRYEKEDFHTHRTPGVPRRSSQSEAFNQFYID